MYDSGLVLGYNFDNITGLNESGTVVKDFSQYANNGTISGATRTGNGKRGGAYIFNGSNNYISLPMTASLTGTPNNQRTMSSWVKISDNRTVKDIIRADRAGNGYFMRMYG